MCHVGLVKFAVRSCLFVSQCSLAYSFVLSRARALLSLELLTCPAWTVAVFAQAGEEESPVKVPLVSSRLLGGQYFIRLVCSAPTV